MVGWKRAGLALVALVAAVAVTIAITVQFSDRGKRPAPAEPQSASPVASPTVESSVLHTAPVRAPYGSSQNGTIGDYAVPAWPAGVSQRLDDPRFESWLQQAPPTVETPGWAPPISDEVRQDPLEFTRTFLNGFYNRQYAWPRAAWASWVWDAWSVASLTPTSAYAAEVGQPSALYRQRGWFLMVAMAPSPQLEDTFAPASQEAWHKLRDLGATSRVTFLQVAPTEFPLPDYYYDTDPNAVTMEVRLRVETTVGTTVTGQDLHLWVSLNTADESGGYGVQAIGVLT